MDTFWTCVQTWDTVLVTFWTSFQIRHTHFGQVSKVWTHFGQVSKVCTLFGHILDMCPNFGYFLVTFWTHFGHFLSKMCPYSHRSRAPKILPSLYRVFEVPSRTIRAHPVEAASESVERTVSLGYDDGRPERILRTTAAAAAPQTL